MTSKNKNSLIEVLGELIFGLLPTFLGFLLSILLKTLRTNVIDQVEKLTDKTFHCAQIKGATILSEAFANEPKIIDRVSGQSISLDNTRYADFSEWSAFCVNLGTVIYWIWFILVLASILFILLKSRAWDFLKAALIGIPLFFCIPMRPSAYSRLNSLTFFIVFFSSIFYLIYSKKKWYFYLSLISFAVMTLLIVAFG